jgi:hypothetical protein
MYIYNNTTIKKNDFLKHIDNNDCEVIGYNTSGYIKIKNITSII